MKTYLRIVGIFFLIIALAHLLRLLFGATIIFGDWPLPQWFSYLGFCLAGLLSYFGFKYANKTH
jgi:hypothetical protein